MQQKWNPLNFFSNPMTTSWNYMQSSFRGLQSLFSTAQSIKSHYFCFLTLNMLLEQVQAQNQYDTVHFTSEESDTLYELDVLINYIQDHSNIIEQTLKKCFARRQEINGTVIFDMIKAVHQCVDGYVGCFQEEAIKFWRESGKKESNLFEQCIETNIDTADQELQAEVKILGGFLALLLLLVCCCCVLRCLKTHNNPEQIALLAKQDQKKYGAKHHV